VIALGNTQLQSKVALSLKLISTFARFSRTRQTWSRLKLSCQGVHSWRVRCSVEVDDCCCALNLILRSVLTVGLLLSLSTGLHVQSHGHVHQRVGLARLLLLALQQHHLHELLMVLLNSLLLHDDKLLVVQVLLLQSHGLTWLARHLGHHWHHRHHWHHAWHLGHLLGLWLRLGLNLGLLLCWCHFLSNCLNLGWLFMLLNLIVMSSLSLNRSLLLWFLLDWLSWSSLSLSWLSLILDLGLVDSLGLVLLLLLLLIAWLLLHWLVLLGLLLWLLLLLLFWLGLSLISLWGWLRFSLSLCLLLLCSLLGLVLGFALGFLLFIFLALLLAKLPLLLTDAGTFSCSSFALLLSNLVSAALAGGPLELLQALVLVLSLVLLQMCGNLGLVEVVLNTNLYDLVVTHHSDVFALVLLPLLDELELLGGAVDDLSVLIIVEMRWS